MLSCLDTYLKTGTDRATAQAAGCHFPISATRVRFQDRSCEICGGHSGSGVDFPANFLSSGAFTLGQKWPVYQVDTVSPHPTK